MSKNTNLAGQPVICQLLSYLPQHIVSESVAYHQSDKHYKTMSTWKQLVFLMYGVITKCHSLRSLCKNLLFLEDKLMYLNIYQLPAKSTLSDANTRRNSEVFATIYEKLYAHHKDILENDKYSSLIEDGVEMDKVAIFDSSTITLFVDVFKGVGRNPIDGKKKGGLKLHTKLPMTGFVPSVVHMTEGACNDKDFLGHHQNEKGAIYVFDKGYVNYHAWQQMGEQGAFYVTRLNDNAHYQVLEEAHRDPIDYLNGGVIKEEIILLDPHQKAIKARLITYKDPLKSRVLKFVTNMFDYRDQTVVSLYKYRWNIEMVFKRLKQNFELGYFFSDSIEGIKTQIWVALIANLICTVIHKQIKEAEAFLTLVNVAANNMSSYVCIIKIMTLKQLKLQDRDINNVQLHLFENREGVLFGKAGKSP